MGEGGRQRGRDDIIQERRYITKEVNTMTVKEIAECVRTQLEQGRVPFEKEVVLRVGGRDYAVRGVDTSTSAIVLEGGEAVVHEDSLQGDMAEGPGGPEGEGVEPAPPEVGQAIMASDTTPQENQEG
jgi:hypothetical protein